MKSRYLDIILCYRENTIKFLNEESLDKHLGGGIINIYIYNIDGPEEVKEVIGCKECGREEEIKVCEECKISYCSNCLAAHILDKHVDIQYRINLI